MKKLTYDQVTDKIKENLELSGVELNHPESLKIMGIVHALVDSINECSESKWEGKKIVFDVEYIVKYDEPKSPDGFHTYIFSPGSEYICLEEHENHIIISDTFSKHSKHEIQKGVIFLREEQ